MFHKFLLAAAVAVVPMATAMVWSQPQAQAHEQEQEQAELTIIPGSMKMSYGGEPLTEELIEREALAKAVKTAIDQNDFDALNGMARKFRQSRSRTGSGNWHLSLFHWRIETELRSEDESRCNTGSDNFLQRWIAKSPNESTPYVARAAQLENHAWCIRGGGYAHTVSADAFEGFAAKVDEARAFLERHRGVASVDPQYYAVMARIFIDQGVEKAEFTAMLDEGTAREPTYHRTYFDAYRYFQPQWHGSDAEVDEMARYAAERATPDEGPGMYARYYWYALDCDCGDFKKSIDWSTMKRSMNAVMARFPSDWNAASFARISCAMDDADEARRWFLRVKGDFTEAFSDFDELQRCQSMAQPLRRSAQRCMYAAREGWSREDVGKYCRIPTMRSLKEAGSTTSVPPDHKR